MTGMDRIRIRGGRPLSGEIAIGGAKNAALPLMAAGLLTDARLVLTNVPKLADIKTMTELLAQPNDWYAREARCLMAERRDVEVIPVLRKNILESKNDRLALQSVWALYVSGGFNDGYAAKLLTHPNRDIRAWTIRLLGDARRVSPAIQKQLVAQARTESSPVVRNQLACSAKRLPGKQALPILRELLLRGEDVKDPQIPLLLWWAIEDKAISDRPQVLKLFADPPNWQAPRRASSARSGIGRNSSK